MRAALACGVLFAGLTAAAPVPKDPPLPPVTEENLKASKENLKEIALASISYADVNSGPMATDITDKDGKPLLSWRVAILPFLEQVNLFRAFKLDEPWDSDNNKKLIAKMPKIYAPVRVKAREGETYYQVFFGKDALFGPKQRPQYPASITDGTANTGLVFEAGNPVIWTKPADLPFDAKKALPKLGGLFDGDFHVALCDGSVMRIRRDCDVQDLKNLIMPADGNVIDLKKLEQK